MKVSWIDYVERHGGETSTGFREIEDAYAGGIVDDPFSPFLGGRFQTALEGGLFNALLGRIEQLSFGGQAVFVDGNQLDIASFFVGEDVSFANGFSRSWFLERGIQGIRDVAFLHFSRNLLNDSDLSYEDIIGAGYNEYTWSNQSATAFHRYNDFGFLNNENNFKIVAEDGGEYIFRHINGEFELVTDPRNSGSYNFINDDGDLNLSDEETTGHNALDIRPFTVFGNNFFDPSAITQRQLSDRAVGNLPGILPDKVFPLIDSTLTGDDRPNNLASDQSLRTMIFGLSGDDTLTGGPQHDTLDGGSGSDTASYRNSDSGVAVNLEIGFAHHGAASRDNDRSEHEQLISIENAIGSDFGDILVGSSVNNVFDGRAGNDVIDGLDGEDTVRFSDDLASYAGSSLADGGVLITHIPSGEMDRLYEVEQFEFADSTTDVFLNPIEEEPLDFSLTSDGLVPENDPGVWISTSVGTIYRWDAVTNTLLKIVETDTPLTDIAIDQHGQLFGITFEELFKIDLATGNAQKIGPLQSQGSLFFGVSRLDQANSFDIDAEGVGRVGSANNFIIAHVDLKTAQTENLAGPVLNSRAAGDILMGEEVAIDVQPYIVSTQSFNIASVAISRNSSTEFTANTDFIGSNEVFGLARVPANSIGLAGSGPVGFAGGGVFGFVGKTVYDIGNSQPAFGPGVTMLDLDGDVFGAASFPIPSSFRSTTEPPVVPPVERGPTAPRSDAIVEPTENGDELLGTAASDRIEGLGGRDRITGLQGRDTLLGGEGNDVIRGGIDNDNLRGGDGDDMVRGQNGADRMFGNLGNDSLVGSIGEDTLKGNAGDDRMIGGGASDRLFGGAGDDTLIGSAGEDRLLGGAGDDVLNGGTAADRFIFRQNAGDDVIVEFEDGLDLMRIQNGVESFANLVVTQVGADVMIAFTGSTIILRNTDRNDITEDDFLF